MHSLEKRSHNVSLAEQLRNSVYVAIQFDYAWGYVPCKNNLHVDEGAKISLHSPAATLGQLQQGK